MQAVVPAPGDVVWIRQRRWRVERAIRDRGVVRLDVANRDERLTFLAPFDRPASVSRTERPRRARPQRALARLAHLIATSRSWRVPSSVIDADVAILPHQLEPALAIADGARRVLVADDVGLGKTIQAGLVIAETLRRHVAPRILVIVPASLRDQWIDEMRRRFRVTCRSADRAGLGAAVRSGRRHDNPWSQAGVWITSLDYLKQPHVLDTLPTQPWDLIVVDEAHDACGDSDRHDACGEIARQARHVLLLTATPHTGDETRFRRLLNLGAFDGMSDPVIMFRRTRTGLSLGPRPNVRWHYVKPSDAEANLLQAFHAFERAVLAAAGSEKKDPALLLLSVFRKRALSTIGALMRSLERRLEWLEAPERAYRFEWLQPGLDFDDGPSDEMGPDEAAAITSDVGLDGRRERAWIRRLLLLAAAARRWDSKIDRVAGLALRSSEPLVLFTDFRDSLHYVRPRLEALRPLAILHGGQTSAERRLELGRFLGGAASMLLSTDVASQGLNLQERARWVMSLELPWNPGRLEQRAGRVDRIGQSKRVHVTLLVARHEAEAGLLARLTHRTLLARRTLGQDALTTGAPESATLEVSSTLDPSLPLPLPFAASRKWVRPARIAARRLRLQRELARRWRAPGADAGGPLWAPSTLAARLGSNVAVFAVPLVDRSGAVVEQHVVPIRLPWADVDPAVLDKAQNLAAGALSRRAALLERRLRTRLAGQAGCERAILEAIAALHWPDEAQPGLFDRRELDLFDAARRSLSELRSRTSSPCEAGDELPLVTVGRPTLELVLIRRS